MNTHTLLESHSSTVKQYVLFYLFIPPPKKTDYVLESYLIFYYFILYQELKVIWKHMDLLRIKKQIKQN